MKTKQTTVRMHMNPSEALGTLSHVLEKEFRDKEAHINPDGEFEVWVNKGVYETYKEVFGEAIETYNQKQKRKDRRITDSEGDCITGYIKSIKNSKRGKRRKVVEKKLDDGTVQKIEIENDNGQRVLYELVVSAGNCNKLTDERGRVVYTEDGHEIHPYRVPREVNKRAMKKFLDEFERAYPNFKVAVAAYHADEQYLNGKGNYEWGIEHMHLNFIPVASGYTRGLSVQASISKALEQMGFKNGTDADGVYRNAYWQFCNDAQKRFEKILQVEYAAYSVANHMEYKPIEIIHPDRGQGKKNLDPDAYRTLKELENRKRSVTADLGEIREQKQSVEEEVVKAKKRLKKANTRSEDVLLEAMVTADERVADMEYESIRKRLELEEELVSARLEVVKADAYYEDTTRQADDMIADAIRVGNEFNKKFEDTKEEYNIEFGNCRKVLNSIRESLKEYQEECEEIVAEDIQVNADEELMRYLNTMVIQRENRKLSLLEDFTEYVEKERRRRAGNASGSAGSVRKAVESRLDTITDCEKWLQEEQDEIESYEME